MRIRATMGTAGSPGVWPERALPTAVWRALMVSGLMLGLVLVSGSGQMASAQDDGGPVVVDPTSCGHFETQADATEALHSGELANPEHLDPDGDGIACETRWPTDPDSPPPVYDPTSCGHFETQADAQAAFDAGDLPDAENLDADGDGIVCETRWGETEPADTSGGSTSGAPGDAVVALPATGSGSATTPSASGLALLLAGMALTAASAGLAMRRRLSAGLR